MSTAVADRDLSFEYTFLSVKDMQVESTTNPKTGRKTATAVIIKDAKYTPSDRFWSSLYSRYGFSESFFKYYDYSEVFTRIAQVEANDRMRVCVERSDDGSGMLLAVSNPTKPIVVYDELIETLSKYGGESSQYHAGIVESSHTPRSGSSGFDVSGDLFKNKFLMSTPIDGYGAPNIYISLEREICTNGVIGYSKSFKSSLSLGRNNDDVTHSLVRALDGFGNDEGYAAIRQRLENATRSWASVYEANMLYDLLVKNIFSGKVESKSKKKKSVSVNKYLAAVENEFVGGVEGINQPLIAAFHKMTGDANKIYGVANMDAFSQKRLKTLPVKCTVYDLINFATEISTHYALPSAARNLNGWVGTLITDEYDMEGTVDARPDFADFHTNLAV